MDAIGLLNHDHRMVEQLFRDYAASASDSQRTGVVDIMIRELSKHAALQELMVYPLAKQVMPDQLSAIDERLRLHMDVKHTLVELDRARNDRTRTDELMRDLRRKVEDHVRADEDELLPGLRDAVDQEALDELGRALDEGKKIAPTRAHPHAPDEPPLLALAAPVAALYDRLRDRLEGRPPT